MKNVKVEIVGLSPLIQDAMTAEEHMRMVLKLPAERESRDVNITEMKEARAYRDNDGFLVHPTRGLITAIWTAAKRQKVGRSSAANLIRNGAITLFNEWVPIYNSDWTRASIVESHMSCPRTDLGALTPKIRAKINDWRMRFFLEVDVSEINIPLLENILRDAGRRQGLGCERPPQKGAYGTFRVSVIDIVPDAESDSDFVVPSKMDADLETLAAQILAKKSNAKQAETKKTAKRVTAADLDDEDLPAVGKAIVSAKALKPGFSSAKDKELVNAGNGKKK